MKNKDDDSKEKKELKVQLALFASIINSSEDAIISKTPGGIITSWNQGAQKIFRYTAAEITGKHISILIPHHLQYEEDEIMKKICRGKIFDHYETERVRKDGKIIYVSLSITPIKDEAENITGASEIVRDISERKNTEGDIVKTNKEKETTLNRISDAVVSVDKEWRYTFLNAAAVVLNVFDRNELMGRVMWDIHPKMKGTFFWNTLHEAMQTGNAIEFENFFIQHKTWYCVKAYPSADGMTIYYKEISENKKAEQQKEFDQSNLRSLINNTKDLMWSVDKDLRLVTCNDSFNRAIELASGKRLVKGDNILSMQFTKEQLKRYKIFYERALSGEIFTIIDHFEYPAEFWVEISFYPIRNGNTVIGTACFSRDITIQKKTMEEIKSTAEQLRKLTAHLQTIREEERKRIAREIHDELGQLLTAIKMDVAWIDEKTPAETVPVKNKLKNIITLLDRSNQSVRNILNRLRPVILNDYGLMDALDWQNRQFTEATGIPVKFITAETAIMLPEEIVTGIFRVYQESLTNIMRYAKARKVITTLNTKNNIIFLTVQDNGKGFEPAVVPIKKSFGILGMKERVLSLNGKFELVSLPGKGTKISISLPYKRDIQT